MNRKELEEYINFTKDIHKNINFHGYSVMGYIALYKHIIQAPIDARPDEYDEITTNMKKIFDFLRSDNGLLLFLRYSRQQAYTKNHMVSPKGIDGFGDIARFFHDTFPEYLAEDPKAIYNFEYIATFCF